MLTYLIKWIIQYGHQKKILRNTTIKSVKNKNQYSKYKERKMKNSKLFKKRSSKIFYNSKQLPIYLYQEFRFVL